MGHITGEGRGQSALFPLSLDDLLAGDHACRVIDAFVSSLDLQTLGFARSKPAATGRPGYDPGDLLRLYLYGYLQQIRSSRRLEAECGRNIELMWLLGRLVPDHKVIAEFRRWHGEAVAAAGVALIQWAKAQALLQGRWVAIDGSKFRAVSSKRSVAAREAWARTWASWTWPMPSKVLHLSLIRSRRPASCAALPRARSLLTTCKRRWKPPRA